MKVFFGERGPEMGALWPLMVRYHMLPLSEKAREEIRGTISLGSRMGSFSVASYRGDAGESYSFNSSIFPSVSLYLLLCLAKAGDTGGQDTVVGRTRSECWFRFHGMSHDRGD